MNTENKTAQRQLKKPLGVADANTDAEQKLANLKDWLTLIFRAASKERTQATEPEQAAFFTGAMATAALLIAKHKKETEGVNDG